MFKKILTYSILSLVGMMGFLGDGNSILHTPLAVQDSYAGTSNSVPCGQPGSDATECNGKKTDQNADMQTMLNKLVAGLNIILDILTIIVSPAIMLAGWLMSPDWTSGDLFGIRPVLHSLWVTVSNIVYFVYAVLLIFIALATIFNSQNYGYKQLLPKLALGVILVPLTWWFVQFVISVSTYVTASAISIPMQTLSSYSQAGSFWDTPSIPEKIVYENSKMTIDGNPIDNTTKLCTGASKCIKPKDFIGTSGGMYSPLLIYTFSVFKFQNVKFINDSTDVVKAIGSIINQGIVGALMFVVYGLLVLALVFMLLMRAVKLWFYAIFSPLFTIKYVLGDKGFGEADKDGSFKITEFIGLAFVPAVVSLALSFGLIIVSVMHSPMPTTGGANPNSKCEGQVCTLTIMGNPANKIVSTTIGEGNDKKSVTTATVGGVSYEFRGSVTGSPPILSGITSALGATGNLFGTVILDIIALIFIWIAFMAGKGVSKAAGKAIEPFEAMGKKIGSLGASLPKYAPIPGIGVSMTGMDRLAGDVKSNFESASITKAQESRLGQMVNASKYANGDTQTKASELNKDSHEDKFKEAIHLMKRDEGQSRNTDAQKVQLLNSLLGMEENKRKDMIDRLDITNKKELKDQMKEMFDKKETYKEHDQKLEKAKGYIGSGTSSSSGNGATGTTPASANNSGSGKMVINGVTLNYSGVQLNDSPEKVGGIIADYLNSAKATMTKPTKEQIDKLMDELGVNSLKKEETIKALNKKLASDFKEEPKK